MVGILLAIIYLAFVSLGLPDSLLGSAWPTMHVVLDMPISAMGILSTIVSLSTVTSSLFSDKISRHFKTGTIVAVSTLLTAIALLGFSFANKFWMLCLISIPYGLGAGSIDAALNNYIALHYSSRSMSFLHCFWGVGTIISPYIMSYALTYQNSYEMGYRIVAYIQFGITAILFLSLPLWMKVKHINKEHEEVIPADLTFKEKLKIDGLFLIIFGFFAYCALETTLINWASTFFVEAKGISAQTSAAYASLFLIGMTLGRIISGVITNKVGDRNMIRLGLVVIFIGIVLLALPFASEKFAIASFIIIGVGCGPIYPAIISSTPSNFGKENSQAIIGLQMAAAYLGSTTMSPLFGVIANYISAALLPYYVLIFFVIIIVMTELLNRKVDKKKLNAQKNPE